MEPAPIPPDFEDLLTGPVVVGLATEMADGRVQVNPVWCDLHEGHIRINTSVGRVKDRNLSERGRATVLAMAPDNPYRWIEVRGDVVSRDEEGADAHIDDLAELYLGQRPYPFRQPGEARVMVRIAPRRVVSFAPRG